MSPRITRGAISRTGPPIGGGPGLPPPPPAAPPAVSPPPPPPPPDHDPEDRNKTPTHQPAREPLLPRARHLHRIDQSRQYAGRAARREPLASRDPERVQDG